MRKWFRFSCWAWMIAHPLVAALVLWMSLPIASYGFTANGHNVIEATAYRHILAQANIERLSMIAGRTFSGKDALDLLIAYRILDEPRGWREGYAKDPLNTLPIIRSGNLDYILSRQFEGNSQCFHFMARASDVYWDTTTDPTYHYPHMLYDSAYPRCVAFMTSTFFVVLNNALAARSGNHDVYALMHCMGIPIVPLIPSGTPSEVSPGFPGQFYTAKFGNPRRSFLFYCIRPPNGFWADPGDMNLQMNAMPNIGIMT